MKRSEMLKKLEQAIERTTGGNPDTGEKLWPSTDYIAYCVLKCVEENGMVAPPDPTTGYVDGVLGQLCQWEYEGENHE